VAAIKVTVAGAGVAVRNPTGLILWLSSHWRIEVMASPMFTFGVAT